MKLFSLLLSLLPYTSLAVKKIWDGGEHIVVMNNAFGSMSIESLAAKYNPSTVWGELPGFLGFGARLTIEDVLDLEGSDEVAYVEPDQSVYATGWGPSTICPSVQTGDQSWGQSRVTRLTGAGDFSHDPSWGSGVDLYILDTGVNCDHEEFTSCGCGPTFAGGEDGCSDGHYHGSFCASIAAGRTYGVAKSANVTGVKVLSDFGSGSISSIISGMNYVAGQEGNRVASMSLGGGYSQASNDAADALVRAGVALAIAAGNSNRDACSYSPAAAGLPITVGSTDIDDRRSSFSNIGSCVDVFAPGSDITGGNNKPGEYVTGSGTSMATPHVAGALAALRGEDPSLSPRKLKSLIQLNGLDDLLTDVGESSPNLLLHIDCNEGSKTSC